MRTLRYIVLALLFLLVVTVVIGFFLPAKVHLERSVVINREAAKIFQVINSLENFNKWSPWFENDIHAQYTLSGSKSGVSSKLSWVGNDMVGSGSNEIIDSQENAFIKTQFFFGKSDQPAFSTISLTPENGATKVTWAFDNNFGYNIFYRYFGLVIEDMIAPDYEKGMGNLKQYVESLPIYDYSNISTATVEAELIYTFEQETSMDHNEITKSIGNAYGKIMAFITVNNIIMSGSPKIINKNYNDKTYQFIAAIPVENNDLSDEDNEILASSTYHGQVIKLVHKGSYKNFNQSYTILDAYMQQNNLEKNGNSWEDFVTDPGNVSETELITHIYQPIKAPKNL